MRSTDFSVPTVPDEWVPVAVLCFKNCVHLLRWKGKLFYPSNRYYCYSSISIVGNYRKWHFICWKLKGWFKSFQRLATRSNGIPNVEKMNFSVGNISWKCEYSSRCWSSAAMHRKFRTRTVLIYSLVTVPTPFSLKSNVKSDAMR